MTSRSPSIFQHVRRRGLALSATLSWLAPLLARLVIGLVFVKTGWGKLHNLDSVIEFFRSLGIPAPEIQAPFAASMEFLCGLAVLAGLFTRLASIPLIVIMIVAIKTAKMADFADATGPIEWLNVLFGLSEFLYIVLLVWLALRGAGAFSLDRVLFRGAGDPQREAASAG
ncbi:MAG: DoxX family protein [Planctomycetes bacterium]|nr:DoxX family protein [Planctomycetota bacterium]